MYIYPRHAREGILSQGKIGQDKPIADTSRILSESKRKFDTYEKQALARIYSVQHFRSYKIIQIYKSYKIYKSNQIY